MEMNFLYNGDEFISYHGFIWSVYVYACARACTCMYVNSMMKWQQNEKGRGKDQMGKFTSSPIYYVSYLPSTFSALMEALMEVKSLVENLKSG